MCYTNFYHISTIANSNLKAFISMTDPVMAITRGENCKLLTKLIKSNDVF